MSSPEHVLPSPKPGGRSEPHRAPRRSPLPAGVRPRPVGRDDSLARAVTAAIRHLGELGGADGRASYAERTRVDVLLRETIDQHRARGGPLTAVPAVTVACAHLAAGDVEDAYFALLTARDLL